MLLLSLFVYLLCSFLPRVNAAGVPSLPTSALPAKCNHEASKVTEPPQRQVLDELRRRQNTVPEYYCGTASGFVWTCNAHLDACVASIFPDGDAYQYCSDANLGGQVVFTTAVGSWDSNKACPSSAGTLCCSEEGYLAAVTNLYIANSYTVTGFGCDSIASTDSWIPYKQLLDPPSFSASLAKATFSSSSSVPSSSSTSIPISSSSSTRVEGGGTGTVSSSKSSSGLSSGTKIGIGVGVGVGVGVVLIGGIIFLLWRRRSKKKERSLAELSASQAPYSPSEMKGSDPPHSPPMSYNQSQYYHQGANAGWSPQPEYSPGGYQEGGYGPREMGAQ